MGEFVGKTALITGAAGGIGRAVALAFAAEGCNLALCDLDAPGLAETERLAVQAGARVIVGHVDVAQSGDVSAFVRRTTSELSGLDYAVNNAGVSHASSPIADLSEETFDRVMAINARGVWLCMKYEIQAMLERGGGAIVNVASGTGLVAVPAFGAYVASKHAVIGLTRVAAVDYARKGVRINALCPGFTSTPMARASLGNAQGATEAMVGQGRPIGRVGEPTEQADAILFLCSQKASYMIGHALVVDGGYTIV